MNNKGVSPIEILVTIMIWGILLIGITFAEGAVIDGFIYQFSKMPIHLSPEFQTMMMNSPVKFAEIFFSIPAFMMAVLIVWAVKSIIRKHGYSRQQNDEFYMEEF